jgi:hypothetical protein
MTGVNASSHKGAKWSKLTQAPRKMIVFGAATLDFLIVFGV